MSNDAKSLFTSPPFKFIVDGAPIYIHASLISQHSKPLERMINGQMKEAQQGFAEMKEVDEGTANHEIKPNNNDKKPTPRKTGYPRKPSVSPLSKISDEVGPVFDPKQSTRQTLKEAFIERKCTIRPATIHIPPPRANKDSTEDYTAVFLCHARLYVFADQFDIQPLKALAFEELQLTLTSYTLYPERTGDIVALLRFIYTNTGESVDGFEDLRTLLTAYMGYEMDVLIEDRAFKELMFEDGGALLGDFMGVVGERI